MQSDGRLHSAPASVWTISQTAAVRSQLPHGQRSRPPSLCVIYGAPVLQSLRHIYWGGGGKKNSALLHVRLWRDEPPWKWQLRGSISVPQERYWRDWLQELRRFLFFSINTFIYLFCFIFRARERIRRFYRFPVFKIKLNLLASLSRKLVYFFYFIL